MPPLTVDDLFAAPMFTVFHGLKGRCAVDKRATAAWWGESMIIGDTANDAVLKRAAEMEIKIKQHGAYPFEIERDDMLIIELGLDREFGDDEAALCYLNEGGVLAKLPDAMDSKLYRLYVVETPQCTSTTAETSSTT